MEKAGHRVKAMQMTKNLEGWDYIKHLLALAHCGRNFSRPGTVRCYNDDIENRKMIIAFMKDYYGLYSTIFVSLNGSPPKAYAILQVHGFREFELIKEDGELKAFYPYSGKNGDEIEIEVIKVLHFDLSSYRTIRGIAKPVVELSLKELLSRKDVVIMNAGAI
ncbi:hypothetical protein [Sulfolobus spindle-shaped virus]|nr:hypothetical protein [Sulfolobus spindle-shaped virus]